MQGTDSKTLLIVLLVALTSWSAGYLMQPQRPTRALLPIDADHSERVESALQRIEQQLAEVLRQPASNPFGHGPSSPIDSSGGEPLQRRSLEPDPQEELLEQIRRLSGLIEERSTYAGGGGSSASLRQVFDYHKAPNWWELDKLTAVYDPDEDNDGAREMVRFYTMQDVIQRFGRPSYMEEDSWSYTRQFEQDGLRYEQYVEFSFHHGLVSWVDTYREEL